MWKITKNFLLTNFFLFLLQLFFLAQQSHSFVSTLPLPKPIYWELGFTLYLQGFSYFLLSIIQSTSYLALKRTWQKYSSKTYQILLVISAWGALFFLNAYYFPLSLYARGLNTLLSPALQLLLGLLFLTILLMPLVHLILSHFFRYMLLSIMIFSLYGIIPPSRDKPVTAAPSKPNIFIIGIDSLSPKSIHPDLMPMTWNFINQNVWFEETISPLARTYPAWSTILSGLHPFHHKARYNLIAQDNAAEKSMAWKMSQANYTTLFATDDRRFNLLDESFGFQHIIGPRRGVNDIFLGTFNDFLLGNFLINTPFGRSFFPYNYMNRASYFSYYPETFNKELQQAIQRHSPTKPLFMAVHFTLPHWPYAYAATRDSAARDEYNLAAREPIYRAALHDVDKQMTQLFQALKKNHLLQNTFVIVLSDHGETLYTPLSRPMTRAKYQGDRVSAFEAYLMKYTSTPLDRSAGHGSDVLSPEQFHCLLALQYYKDENPMYPHEHIKDRVGLQDIAPTLLDYTHQSNQNLDGISLRPRIEKTNTLPERAFILESGMLPNQFLSREKARLAGQTFFEVDSAGLLHLRQNKLSALDKDKLYAILKNNWILALYPTTQGYLTIIQELQTQAWVDDLNTPFAHQTPAQALLKELQTFYD